MTAWRPVYCRRHCREINLGCAGGQHLGGKAVQPVQGLLQPGTAIRSGGVGAGWSGGEAAIRSGGVGSSWSGGAGGGRRSGHGVGDHVLLAGDVPDVAGIFCYVGQMAALALAKVNVMGLWSVSIENSHPSSMCLKWRIPAVQARSSLSKAE
jgi:hypothetical protein